MKKSSKRFTISSEAKNDKGFRVRTAGIDISGYKTNPIMLFMHQRPKGLKTDEVGVIGNFVDLEFENSALLGTPLFDDTDPFAIKLFNKVENGTMRMVSAGLLPLKFAKDSNGEVWLEKSKLIEISLADIGSNEEALAVALYNENDELIQLSLAEINENLKPEINMKTIELKAVAPILGLDADTATVADATAAIATVVALASDQQKTIKKREDALEALQKKYDDQEEITLAATQKAYVKLASDEGKFVAGDIPKYEKLMKEAPEATKELIEGLPKNKSVVEQLKFGEDTKEFVKLSWSELESKNMLVALKAKDLPLFKEKFKTEFNTEYKEN